MTTTPDQQAELGLDAQTMKRIRWIDRANLDRLEMAQAMVRPTPPQRRKHEPRRAASKKCKACYYLRGAQLAGRAFRDFVCGICKETKRHANTAVPKYCQECCDKHELCQTCGGRINPW
jgi:hypothetical protein